MDCEKCTEYLADFLLDELPEAEAVLIQEHLNLCPACMKAYRELKGTGKMLEAVPAMRPVQGTPDFSRAVRAEASVESAKIIRALPPEKRLRVEARRAARLTKFASQRSEKVSRSRVWGVVLALIIGVTALILIFFTGKNSLLYPHTQLGALSLVNGAVETGNASEGRSPRAAHEGETIYAGDTVITPEGGRARIDLNDGTALFIGPSSHVTLEPQSSSVDAFSISVESGELGVNKPLANPDKNAPRLMKWDVHSDLGLVLPDPGTQLFVNVTKNGSAFDGSALVVSGSAIVVSRHAGTEVTTTLGPGSKYLEGSGQPKGRTESVVGARVPGWRVELATEADLQRLFNGRVKLRSRSSSGVEVELTYGRETKQLTEDWLPEPAGPSTLSKRPDGAIAVPNARFAHIVPFAGPISMTLTLNRDVRAERSLAFGALYSPERGVSVDVSRDAVMQVRENNTRAHSSNLSARKESDKPEKLGLEIKTDRGGYRASMSSRDEKSTGYTLPPNFGEKPGQLWLQGLSDGIAMDEIKISGTIPSEWLSEALSRLGKQ